MRHSIVTVQRTQDTGDHTQSPAANSLTSHERFQFHGHIPPPCACASLSRLLVNLDYPTGKGFAAVTGLAARARVRVTQLGVLRPFGLLKAVGRGLAAVTDQVASARVRIILLGTMRPFAFSLLKGAGRDLANVTSQVARARVWVTLLGILRPFGLGKAVHAQTRGNRANILMSALDTRVLLPGARRCFTLLKAQPSETAPNRKALRTTFLVADPPCADTGPRERSSIKHEGALIAKRGTRQLRSSF